MCNDVYKKKQMILVATNANFSIFYVVIERSFWLHDANENRGSNDPAESLVPRKLKNLTLAYKLKENIENLSGSVRYFQISSIQNFPVVEAYIYLELPVFPVFCSNKKVKNGKSCQSGN